MCTDSLYLTMLSVSLRMMGCLITDILETIWMRALVASSTKYSWMLLEPIRKPQHFSRKVIFLCFVDRASLYNLVNKTKCTWFLSIFVFINLYMFRPTMCPSSEDTTVFMLHLVLVILWGWLSGTQRGIPPCTPSCAPSWFYLQD